MIYFDYEDNKDQEETTEPSDFSKKLKALAEQKEAEDAVRQEQPDPLKGYEIGDKKTKSDEDGEEIVPVPATTAGTDPAGAGALGQTGVPPVVVKDDDEEDA